MERVRAFFCLPLPEPLLRDLQSWMADAAAVTGRNGCAKWVSRDALHVTLRFCGEISPEQVKFLTDRVNELAAEKFTEPFSLSLTNLGTFGRPPRVLWAGLSGEIDRVRELNARLERICREGGLESDEKRYSPHLTLARFRVPPTAEIQRRIPGFSLEGRQWTADKIIFMRSRLTPQGPRYSPLAEFRAGGEKI